MGHSARALGAIAAALCAGLAGCATCPESIRASLQPTAFHARDTNNSYALACPDGVILRVDGRPELNADLVVEPDGCVSIKDIGRVRVDGATADDVARLVSLRFGVAPSLVQVEVVNHASQQLTVCGPGAGSQRVVPYLGRETLTNFCRRTGGLADNAAFQEIFVVRSHVADGRRPEVFHVDLEAILLRGDNRSDIILEPSDQIYFGETKGAAVGKCLPQWLRSLCPGAKGIDGRSAVANNKGA